MISFTLLSITFSVCFDLRIINCILDKNMQKTYNIIKMCSRVCFGKVLY